jgi:hypothetical protein
VPVDRASSSFLHDGYLWVREAFSESDAAAIATRVWNALEEDTGIRRDDASTWSSHELSSEKGQLALKRLNRTAAVAEVGSERVSAALDSVMGERAWNRPRDWGGLLMTFPEPGTWTVPSKQWHVDLAVDVSGSVPCARLFAFVLPALPGGGGTAIVAGSHRLTARLAKECGDGHAKTLRKAMTAHPWLGRLMSDVGTERERFEEFMNTGWSDGQDELRVVELTGAPGDVFIFHPGTLHAPCRNVNATPRLMVTATISARPR